jgi:hypothetical protein
MCMALYFKPIFRTYFNHSFKIQLKSIFLCTEFVALRGLSEYRNAFCVLKLEADDFKLISFYITISH